jgi:Fe(3+) dicitrate transport protein
MRQLISAAALATITSAVPAIAATAQQNSMEHVAIVGSSDDVKKMSGSAYVVDSEELAKFEYSDIHRVLRQIPGVYVQQEDGYGLRPNIGIRGAGGSRSEKITLLEDGVLIAPAPYSGPSAYYFPTTGRMSAVEVLKGPESISQGPYTVGGAINLISTPIPSAASGELQLELGEDGESRVHAWYGDSAEQYGWLVETHQHDADGFKQIDRSERDTGLNKEDYMVKLRLNSEQGAELYNQLDIKLQYSTEVSNQSYLGLTDSDFDADSNRRYGLSELDQMDNEHAGINVSHLIVFSEELSLKTTAYYNDFERDWFKLSGGGSLIKQANAGDANAIGVLQGTIDSEDIAVKHNAREYESYGVQSTLTWKFEFAGMQHDLDIGGRWHEDEVDRFQPTEIYDQVNGSLVYQSTTQPSSSNNRVEQAEALSLFLVDHIALTDRLDITAALRYEDYETDQTRYGDLGRDAISSFASSSNDETLLGLGATYQVNDQWSLLAGVHQGFAPAGVASTDDPEESTNYEAGVRFNNERLSAEAIYFFSDYKNSVQYCTFANPCGGQTAGSISQGEAEIVGLELLINYELSTHNAYSMPLTFSYTYTDAEIIAIAVIFRRVMCCLMCLKINGLPQLVLLLSVVGIAI